MKKLLLPLALVATSGLLMAGGDLVEVEPVVEVPVVKEVSENNFYAGLGIAAVSARDTHASLDFFGEEYGQDRLGNLDFIVGYEFHRHFAVEARYTTSIAYEDIVEMDGWSIFAKPKYPVTENVTIYGLLGYGNVQMDGVDGVITDMDESGFQWGLGLSYMINENFDLFADYKFLANDFDGIYAGSVTEINVDSVTVGIMYNF
ncbi:MAG: porin family protein [Sulfurovum sp.]|nr:porin family protein [Sulfurovum sp.]